MLISRQIISSWNKNFANRSIQRNTAKSFIITADVDAEHRLRALNSKITVYGDGVAILISRNILQTIGEIIESVLNDVTKWVTAAVSPT